MLDDRRGMPELSQPPPLSGGTLSTQEIRDEYVAYEGLGFCILHYIPTRKIESKELRVLWRKAKLALAAVVDCLEGAPEELGAKNTYRSKPRPEAWENLLEE